MMYSSSGARRGMSGWACPSQKHAERLNGHPACDNKGAQRETQSRPQKHCKIECADNEQTSTRCVRTEGPEYLTSADTKLTFRNWGRTCLNQMITELDSHSIHPMVHCLQHCRATRLADGQFTDGSSKDQGWAGGKTLVGLAKLVGSSKQQTVRVRRQTNTTE